MKFYPNRFNVRHVKATLCWTPQFLSSITKRFGIREEFTSAQVEDIFEGIITRNAVRKKLKRLYNGGIFKREQIKINGRKVFVYHFNDRWKRYYIYYQGFDYDPKSPLMKNQCVTPKY